MINKKILSILLLALVAVTAWLYKSAEANFGYTALAAILSLAILILAYTILNKAVGLFADPNIINKPKITLVSLFLLNFSFIYRFYPALVLGEGNPSGVTYFWAWATLSV